MTGTPAADSAAVEVVTIGDELLLGYTIDTNGAYLSRRLAAIGIVVSRRTSVGDDPHAIAAAVRDALDRTGGVITTGGLGPTTDDRSKAAIAELFGRRLVTDEEHLAWMHERWRTRFGREMPQSNVMQAMLPEGATKLPNQHGSAPGVFIEDTRGRWVAMLPGVPREMRGMTDDTLIPLLSRRLPGGAVIQSRTLRTTGVAESLLGDNLGDIVLGDELSLAYLPSAEGVDLRLTLRGKRDTSESMLSSAAARLRERVGESVYGDDDVDLAAVVLDICRARKHTLAVAESCTGGMLGARLTAIPGSSDVVLGGVIAYHDRVKRELLDVSEADLRAHGAVSEVVARQMAVGARDRLGSTAALSITGVAGPGGGSAAKPVGTVWIGMVVGGEVTARRFNMIGDRDEIRRRSAQAALEFLRRALL